MNLRTLKKWVRSIIVSITWSPWGYFDVRTFVWAIFWPEALLQRQPLPLPSARVMRQYTRTRWYTSTLHATARGLLLGP